MICSNARFFSRANPNVPYSYQRSGVTVALDPPLEMHLQGRVTPSAAPENYQIILHADKLL